MYSSKEIDWVFNTEQIDDYVLCTIKQDKELITSGYLYPIHTPIGCIYGLIDDVVTEDKYKNMSFEYIFLNLVITYAKKLNMYKVIINSKFDEVSSHKLYESVGFKKNGYELRMEL